MNEELQKKIDEHVEWYEPEARRLIAIGYYFGVTMGYLQPTKDQVDEAISGLAIVEAEHYRNVATHFAKHAENIYQSGIPVEKPKSTNGWLKNVTTAKRDLDGNLVPVATCGECTHFCLFLDNSGRGRCGNSQIELYFSADNPACLNFELLEHED